MFCDPLAYVSRTITKLGSTRFATCQKRNAVLIYELYSIQVQHNASISSFGCDHLFELRQLLALEPAT